MLRSGLCDYSGVYIVVKGLKEIMMIKLETKIFKNNDLFRSCISKINNSFIDNAEDIDIAVLLHNSLEYEDESGNDNINNNDE